MSRSGYSDDCYGWASICWRGAVESAIRGKRGQAFLRELRSALDAMPVKELIPGALEDNGQVCAIGAVGKSRGVDMHDINIFDRDKIAEVFGIAPALVAEIEDVNDDDYGWYSPVTPEQRWRVVSNWVDRNIRSTT